MRVSLVRTLALFSALIGLALACSSSSYEDHERAGSGSSAAAESAAAKNQIARGGQVFGQRCARCHGDAGQGTEKAPPLVGQGALPLVSKRPETKRTMPFHTALDVAGFATKNMPPDPKIRAEIPESDYWAVVAFALSANGVELTQPVVPTNAASIVLHP